MFTVISAKETKKQPTQLTQYKCRFFLQKVKKTERRKSYPFDINKYFFYGTLSALSLTDVNIPQSKDKTMKNILTKSKVFSAGLVLAMAMVGTASAATITFGNATNLNGVAQVADDGSGLTSVNVPSTNLTDGSNGYFVETFDKATQTLQPEFLPDGVTPNPEFGNAFPDGTMAFNDAGFDGCAINGVGSGITINSSSGSAFGVRQGSVVDQAASPANDTTCFGYTPQDSAVLPSWVEIDYSLFLAANSDVGITFLGFYWGSIDTYNDFTFFNAGGGEIQTITGSSLLSQAGGTSGNQSAPGSNLYVAIDFSLAESFTKLRITSTGVAGEFDNIVIGLQNRPVPAPAGVAVLALGLLGLGLRKRLAK